MANLKNSQLTNKAMSDTKVKASENHYIPEPAFQELIFRLKAAIDQRGRYSDCLNDLATGYAAGRKIAPAKARVEIEKHFQMIFGQTPHAYLEKNYEALKANA